MDVRFVQTSNSGLHLARMNPHNCQPLLELYWMKYVAIPCRPFNNPNTQICCSIVKYKYIFLLSTRWLPLNSEVLNIPFKYSQT